MEQRGDALGRLKQCLSTAERGTTILLPEKPGFEKRIRWLDACQTGDVRGIGIGRQGLYMVVSGIDGKLGPFTALERTSCFASALMSIEKSTLRGLPIAIARKPARSGRIAGARYMLR